jgi:four helix bundle protein
MRLTGHKDLDVWKKSMALVLDVYKNTQNFPSHELYGLTSQIRRSAVSIPSNIAEGAARNSNKDFIRFCYISLGSLAELETQLIISHELKYFENKFEDRIMSIKQMLNGLIASLDKKQNAVYQADSDYGIDK